MAIPASKEAAEAKEAGNTAYKKGKWVDAIGHYTTASVLDPTDPAPLLNRAQAFLKIDKWNDAERDCTRVLELKGQERNVKALFRRAVARRELGKGEEARRDLDQLLVIEPRNVAAKEELAALASSSPVKPARTIPTAQNSKPAAVQPRDRARDIGTRIPVSVVGAFSPIPAYVPASTASSSGQVHGPAAPADGAGIVSSSLSAASGATQTPAAPSEERASSFSTLRATRSSTKKQFAVSSTAGSSASAASASVSPPAARTPLSPTLASGLRDVRMSSAERESPVLLNAVPHDAGHGTSQGVPDADVLMQDHLANQPAHRRLAKPTSGLEWIMRWEGTNEKDRAGSLLATDPPSLARALENIIEPDHLASLHHALALALPSGPTGPTNQGSKLVDADRPAVRAILSALRGMRGYAICAGLRSAQERSWEDDVERWVAGKGP